jgi:hypothetical protein
MKFSVLEDWIQQKKVMAMEQRKRILDLKSIKMNTHIILDLNGILINKIQQPTHAKGCMHKIMNWRCTLNEDLNDCLF